METENKKKYKLDMPIPINGQILVEEIDYEEIDNDSKGSNILLLKKEHGTAPDPTIGKVISVAEILPETAKGIKIGDLLMINPFSDRRIRVRGKWYLLVYAQTDVYARLPLITEEPEESKEYTGPDLPS